MTAEYRPQLWVLTDQFGVDSQTWLWRQTCGFARLRTHVVTAERLAPERFPLCPGVSLSLNATLGPPSDDLRRWLRRAGRLRHGNFLGLSRRQGRILDAIATQRPPAVLLAHFGHMVVRFQPWATRRAVPLVGHFHGLDLSSSLRNNRWYRASLVRALPHLSAAVIVGSHQRELLLDLGMPESRVHLIPCGVPVESFPPRVPHTGTEARFIAVSRLVPSKGLDLTIRAFARVFEEVSSAELVIIGEGRERQGLQELAASLGAGEAVTFRGSLPPDAVGAELRRASVFLQHSLARGGSEEGFGISITEAAVTGLPIVASRCGGIPDQVTDGTTGFLIEQGDVEGMAARMRQLVEDPYLRNTLGDGARMQALERFDAAKQIRELERLLINADAEAAA